jgi:hypothetical protein
LFDGIFAVRILEEATKASAGREALRTADLEIDYMTASAPST